MKKYSLISALFFIIIFGYYSNSSAEYKNAPVDIQSSLFIKLFLFNNDFNNGKDIVVHVINSSEFAAEIRKSLGKKIGKSKLARVTESEGMPYEKPSVVYLGNPALLEELIDYTQKNKVLSITGIPELVEKGIALGIGVSEQKPKILFNVSASEKEDMNWNPIILKISTLIKQEKK
ncbi:DUF4154 [Desulfonema limicola]|uniref:DUF4154 n=1 Tax=Desulfonema limicola TaxID=45656 RepID=A0A975GJG5_9BACT|nr:YfiR/HmsC family protein [Desulfonema limicola]QTA83008.1 DUF4154 [Desulfonema limicola]